jgi:DDE superfamily endonuclease
MGKTTIASIVYDTCSVLWSELVNIHMPQPTQVDLRKIADDYFRLWQFPHCIGSIDGRHCEIICPANSGSAYYNYKQYFSIILQAVADANKKFITIEVGGRGRQSDGGTFHYSLLNELITNGSFNIPPADIVPGTTHCLPFVLIGDEAYPLKRNLMRPFPSRTLNEERSNFNSRLSRARKCIECAFGILYAKWRILAKPIETNVDHASLIIQAACILHNVIRDLEGNNDPISNITVDDNIRQHENRNVNNRRNNSSSLQAKAIRNLFVNFFSEYNNLE